VVQRQARCLAARGRPSAARPLIGGRLDHIHNRVVGALVFKHGQHVINLFVWAVADLKESGPTSMTREGFNLLHWTCSGMSFWGRVGRQPCRIAPL